MLDNEVLETLNREFISRILLKILARLKKEVPEKERITLLNSLDQNGVSLLHYLIALNYFELIKPLCEMGVDINLKTLSGLSPLVIAAAKGYEKAVKKLIRLGAILWKGGNEKDFGV